MKGKIDEGNGMTTKTIPKHKEKMVQKSKHFRNFSKMSMVI